MITPTARSITFPLKAKFLNSSKSENAFFPASSGADCFTGSIGLPSRQREQSGRNKAFDRRNEVELCHILAVERGVVNLAALDRFATIPSLAFSELFTGGAYPGSTMDISDLGERLLSDARRFLQCDAADPELRAVCHNCLGSLGFDLQQLDSLPIGVFLSPSVMKEGLLRAGFRPEDIIASGLVSDPRVAGRLIGPIRNAKGQILNFWARHPEGLRPNTSSSAEVGSRKCPPSDLTWHCRVWPMGHASFCWSKTCWTPSCCSRPVCRKSRPRWVFPATLPRRDGSSWPPWELSGLRSFPAMNERVSRVPRWRARLLAGRTCARSLRAAAGELRPRERPGQDDPRDERRPVLVMAEGQPRPAHGRLTGGRSGNETGDLPSCRVSRFLPGWPGFICDARVDRACHSDDARTAAASSRGTLPFASLRSEVLFLLGLTCEEGTVHAMAN